MQTEKESGCRLSAAQIFDIDADAATALNLLSRSTTCLSFLYPLILINFSPSCLLPKPLEARSRTFILHS